MNKQQQALAARIETAWVQLAEIPVAYRGMSWQLANNLACEVMESIHAQEKFAVSWNLWKECRAVLKDAVL